MPLLTVTNRPHRRVTPATDPLNNSVLSPGSLVAWWKADEASGTVLKDYSGNGFDATYNTGSGFLSYRNTPLRTGSAGCIGMSGLAYAAVITTSGSLASVGHTSTDTWTLVAFVKKTGGGGVGAKFFGYGPANISVENGPCLEYRGTGSNFAVTNTGSGANRIQSPNNTGGTVIMIAATKDSGTGYTLWENGTSVATATFTYGTPTNSTVEFLGATVFPGSGGFIGLGSDFIIYNTALNSTQLTAIAHAGGLV